MQDPDIPPAVVEGEASGDAGVVRPIVVARLTAATASSIAASTAHPWTTATAPPWAGTMDRDRDACVPDLLRLTFRIEPEPLPQGDNGNSRIFAFVDDLFFQAKIQETARKLNVKVEFVKTEKDLLDHMKLNGEEKPSLIIFDMNNANAKPLTLIPKLKTKLKKGTSIIGFLSHVQGDLKMKAHEVGCDMVLPRSAFSQNLPQLLRRHGAPEAEATN